MGLNCQTNFGFFHSEVTQAGFGQKKDRRNFSRRPYVVKKYLIRSTEIISTSLSYLNSSITMWHLSQSAYARQEVCHMGKRPGKSRPISCISFSFLASERTNFPHSLRRHSPRFFAPFFRRPNRPPRCSVVVIENLFILFPKLYHMALNVVRITPLPRRV